MNLEEGNKGNLGPTESLKVLDGISEGIIITNAPKKEIEVSRSYIQIQRIPD